MIFAISASNNLQSRLCLCHHSTLFSPWVRAEGSKTLLPPPLQRPHQWTNYRQSPCPWRLRREAHSLYTELEAGKHTWAQIPGYRHTGLILSPTNGKKKQTVKGYSVCFLMSYHILINSSERIQAGSFQGRETPPRQMGHPDQRNGPTPLPSLFFQFVTITVASSFLGSHPLETVPRF